MTIGELPKEYRISQGKNKKKFINPKFSQIAYTYLSFNISSLLRKSKNQHFLLTIG